MLPPTMMRKAQAADGHRPKAGVKTEIKRSVCTHCSVGCGVIAEVQNGVWTGQEPDFDSPFNLGAHCAKGASVREHGHRRAPSQVPDEADRRQVEAHLLGRGHQRDRRPDAHDSRAVRSRLGVLARLGQAQQRAGLPVPQVRRLLGHQQRRPPGAHLPLHHGGRCCEHLGLRRDDQLLQRHAQLQGDVLHRRPIPPKRIRLPCSTSCAPRRTARR